MSTYPGYFRLIRSGTLLIFLAFFGSATVPCHGQKDSVKYFKNTIRYNLSNPLLFSEKFLVFGYERVIKDHQTASINIGRAGFSKFAFLSDTLGLEEFQDDKGFNLALDYRFYLRNENKHKAPRGVYIGPYYAYNYFSREMTWNLNTDSFVGEVKSGFDVNAHFLGFQLGYQFIFWNRLALDLVLMGPGWWHFKMKDHFDSDLTAEDEEMILDKLNEMLDDKFPGNDLLLGGDGFDISKSSTTDVAGFRYMINIGFRF
jgi:hypothetical protein